LLVDAPRWGLLAALVFAPWAYGTTRPWAVQTLNVMLGGVCLLWVTGCIRRRRWPSVPRMPAGFVAAILLHGWWMALNAHHHLDPATWQLLPNPQWLDGAPGSAEGATSIAAMWTCSGLLGALLFVCELARRPIWRRRIWITIAGIGVSVALFGIIQKIGGDSVLALTWEPAKRDLTNNFAMFRYRGNAGAWLNLVLPLLVALTFISFRKSGAPWSKTLWITALLTVLVGIQLNPSRACWAVAIGLLGVAAGSMAWHVWRRRGDTWDTPQLAVHGGLGLLGAGAIGGIVLWGGWITGWQRLGDQGIDLATRRPIEIYLHMVPDAGVMGYGPGTFEVVFPAYQATHDFGGRAFPAFWITQRWIHAHHDYLQTLIDWGYLGTLLWAGLIGGGLLSCAVRLLRWETDSSLRWLLFSGMLGLLGVLAHATLDFPLQVASIQLYVVVLLGLCWGARDERRRRQKAGTNAG
jgi:hypothetical protein